MHAYSMINSYYIDHLGITLCQIRNPWGQGEWTGAWSDEAGEWDENPDVAEQVGHKVEDDGTFFMVY